MLNQDKKSWATVVIQSLTLVLIVLGVVGCPIKPPAPPVSEICQEGTNQFVGGKDDQFAGTTEPADPSSGLQIFLNQYPAQSGRDFDEYGRNKVFGHISGRIHVRNKL